MSRILYQNLFQFTTVLLYEIHLVMSECLRRGRSQPNALSERFGRGCVEATAFEIETGS
jgi:hypothetical protein